MLRWSVVPVLLVAAILAAPTAHAIGQAEHEAIGFKADHVFDVYTQGENVNVFNGALNLQRTIASYSVNGNLSYAVTLSYGSKEWRINDDETCDPLDDYWELANPGWVSAGWSLHFGHVVEVTVGYCEPREQPSFISGDGAVHRLFPVNGSSQDFITRDSSYIRAWKYVGNAQTGGGWKIFLPDGSILDLRHYVADSHDKIAGWYTTLMVDTWGNRLDLQYAPAPHDQALRQITDAHGRVTKFELWPDLPSIPAEKQGLLRRILFPIFGDDPAVPTGIANFDYEIRTIGSPPLYENPLPAPSATVALLSVLDLPEGATYTYDYDAHGDITDITYPTGAVSHYDHEPYVWKVMGPGRPEDPPLIVYAREQGFGVSLHSLDLDGNPATNDDVATWTYKRPRFIPWNLDTETRDADVPFLVRVRDPVGNDTWHEFAGLRTLPDGTATYKGPTHFLAARHEFAGASELVQPVVGTDWSLTGYVVRRTEQKWEVDGPEPGAGHDSRVSWSKTLHTEDGSWRADSSCDWNGLGHFRTTTLRETSYREAVPLTAVTRSTVTDWAPILCQWILATSSRSEVAEDGLAVETRTRFGIRGELLQSVSDDGFVPPDPSTETCDGAGKGFVTISSVAHALEGVLAASHPSWEDLTAQPFPLPPSECLPSVFVAPLVPGSGDVARTNSWFGPMSQDPSGDWRDAEGYASAGNLKTTTTSGADTLASGSASTTTFTRNFGWAHGSSRWSGWSGMSWTDFVDDIDRATGLRASSSTPGGFKTTYSFDALGRLTLIAPGPSLTSGAIVKEAPTRIDYAFSPPTVDVDKGFATVDPSEHSQEYFTYDGVGRIVRTDRRDADGSIVSSLTTWSPGGLKLEESPPFDTDQAVERAPIATVPAGTIYSYDWILPGSIVVSDPYGRARRVTHADGATATFEFFGLREIRRIFGINGDPLQVAETKLYTDTLGRLGFVDAPTGSADASYQYDVHDDMRRANLDGQLRTWTRDALGRLRQETQPESGMTAFPLHEAYDALGHVLRRVDSDGRVFDSTFDAAGRALTTTVTEPGHAGQLLTRLTYDEADHGAYAASNLTRSEQWNCVDGTCDRVMREQTWSGLSGRLSSLRLTQAACALAIEGGLEYDALGLESIRTQPEITSTGCPYAKVLYLPEIRTSYAYGVPIALGTPLAPASFVKTIGYAANGAATDVMLGNDVRELTTLDERLRTKSIIVKRGTTTLFETGAYAYDGASNIIGFGPTLERAQAQTFGYDLGGRLTSAAMPGVGTFTHAYDPWGNMTSSLLAHGPEPECVPGGFFGWAQFSGRQYLRGQGGGLEVIPTNRMSTLGSTCSRYAGAQVTYDNAGRVTQDDTSLYTWDAQDHLLKRDRLDGGADERHAYDAAGYRATTEISGETRKVEFRGPDGEIWRSFNAPTGGAITLDRDYVRIGRRLVAVNEGSNTVWQHADHLGSTRATTLGGGALRDRFEYTPFGLDLPAASGALPVIGRAFGTHERKGDGTLDYMLARWNSAAMGMFISVDPERGSVDRARSVTWRRYTYCEDAPTTANDPDGREVHYIGGTPAESAAIQALVASARTISKDVDDEMRHFEKAPEHLGIEFGVVPNPPGEMQFGETVSYYRKSNDTYAGSKVTIDTTDCASSTAKGRPASELMVLIHELIGHVREDRKRTGKDQSALSDEKRERVAKNRAERAREAIHKPKQPPKLPSEVQ